MTHNNQTYHLLYNHQRSLRAVVDTEGNIVKELTYDSFGTILHDSNPNLYPKGTSSFFGAHAHLGFAGGLYDQDTKLTRFGYRDYDAETGKWTAKDPIGFAGGDTNLYGYVLGVIHQAEVFVKTIKQNQQKIVMNSLKMIEQNANLAHYLHIIVSKLHQRNI